MGLEMYVGTPSPAGPRQVRSSGLVRHVVAVRVAAAERDPHVRSRPAHRVHGVVLLPDRRHHLARERRVQVVGQLGIALVLDQGVELCESHRTGDVAVGRRHEQALLVGIPLVGPAHVLGQHAAGHHVVGDDGLGGHVPEVGVRVRRAAAHQPLDVLHVERVDELRPELVEHDLHHTSRAVGMPCLPCRGSSLAGRPRRVHGHAGEKPADQQPGCDRRNALVSVSDPHAMLPTSVVVPHVHPGRVGAKPPSPTWGTLTSASHVRRCTSSCRRPGPMSQDSRRRVLA